MSNQYGEPSGRDQQSWGEGGWPQSTPPRGSYGQQGEVRPGRLRPGGRLRPARLRPAGRYGQGGYGQQGGYGRSGPYAEPGQPYGSRGRAPNQAYGPTPTGYQPGPPSPTSQYPAGGYGYSQPPYASWLTRVGAYLVDALPVWVLLAIGAALAGHGGAGAGIGIIFYLAALGWIGYNRWYRAGTTGQSLGKSATNVRLSNEQTGAPIGAGLAFLRDLAHFVDAIICYVGFLFPLWDGKRQTLADKIVGTVVVRNGAVPPQGYQQQQPPSGYGYPQ